MKSIHSAVGRRFKRTLLAAMKRRRRATLRSQRRSSTRFEPLETRLLLAADLGPDQELFELSPAAVTTSQIQAQAEGESSDVGEGEAAQDLVAFARALAASGTRYYGAAWCPHCTSQKELFEDGGDFLPFIEVTNLDNPVTLNAVGTGENRTLNPSGVPVTSFPTWEFPDGTRLEGAQSLQTLSQRSGVAIPTSDQPFIAPIDDGDLDPTDVDDDGDDIVTLLSGSPLHIPLDGYDPGGGPLTYTVTSSDPNLVEASLLQGNRSMQIDVAGWGKMTLQLFEQRAPRPTARLIELAQDDFYDGVTFHRIVNGFVIQGGDPTGTGSGGSQLGDFDDQYHEELQHNRTGTLSYAKSFDDTNDSQFFITEGATPSLRNLDGNHSVAGVLVEGEKNREAISNNSTSNPRGVTMSKVEVFQDDENAVLMLKAFEGDAGEVDITVTATDADGNEFTRTFHVNVQPDTVNTRPWMNDFGELTTVGGETFLGERWIELKDVEGDPIQIGVISSDNFTVGVPTTPSAAFAPALATIDVTPAPGFLGQEEVTFFAYDPEQIDLEGEDVTLSFLQSNSTVFDVQTVTVTAVESDVAAPSSLDLLSITDSGFDPGDNITNFDNSSSSRIPQFRVDAETDALVRLKLDGVTLDQQNAADGSVVFSLDGFAALTQGTQTFTATQEVNGSEGPEVSLDVLIDSIPPLFTSTAPTSAANGEAFSYDAQTIEEGDAGHTYDLLDPVTNDTATSGPVINPTTGVVVWDQPLLGDHQYVVQAVDAAGNTSIQELELTVADPSIVEFRLEAVKDGVPVTQLNVGDTFTLNAYVQDLRDLDQSQGPRGGAFSAYMDVRYNELVAAPVGDLQINGSVFPSVHSGDLSTPGVIDGAGGVAGLTPLGLDEQLLWTLDFETTAGGQLSFMGESTTDPDDPSDASQLISLDVNLFDSGLPTCPTSSGCFGSISFVNPAAITIDTSFNVLDPDLGPDEDTSASLTIQQLASLKAGATGVLMIDAVGAPSHGQVSVAADNLSLTYTPNGDYFGLDEFSYTIGNGDGETGVGRVSVTVHPVNDDPTAVDDGPSNPSNGQSFIITEDTPDNFLPVLENDLSDPDDANSETLTVDTVQAASDEGGTVQRASNGQGILYTPAMDFIGLDTFTYTILDDQGGISGSAVVTVEVRERNDPPSASDDTFPVAGGPTILEGGASVTLDVLANDSTGPDVGETLTIVEVSQPSMGTVEIIENGTKLSYTPDDDFFGTESFNYTIDDRPDGSGERAKANVSVQVLATNDPPTAVDDGGASFLVVRDTQDNSLDVLSNDTSAPDESETLTIVSVSGVRDGASVTIVGNEIRYSPPSGFLGTDTFSYTIEDPGQASDSATVTVSVVDFDPGSLGGFVYVDANNNGVRDAGERALAGIAVSLSGTDLFGSVSQTTVTDDDGEWMFAGLAPGDYIVEQTQPATDFDGDGIPLLDGMDTIGTQGGDVSANDQFTITLAEGVIGQNNNFGELKGLDLGGDVGVGGLRIELFSADALTPNRAIHSSADGTFNFEGIAPSSYRLERSEAPFLVNSAVSMTADLSDTSSLNNDFAPPVRAAVTLTYLDFIAARLPDAVHAAVSPGQPQHWFSLAGDGWTGVTEFAATLSTDATTVALQVTDGSGMTTTGSIATVDPRVGIPAELPDGTKYLRLEGSLQDFADVLTPQTNGSDDSTDPSDTSSQGEAEGETPLTIAGGEGEAGGTFVAQDEQPPLVIQPVIGRPTPAFVTNPSAEPTGTLTLGGSSTVGDALAPRLATSDFDGAVITSTSGDEDVSRQREQSVDQALAVSFEVPPQDQPLDQDELERLAASIVSQQELLEAIDQAFADSGSV